LTRHINPIDQIALPKRNNAPRLKVAVAASGRFHLLDLARELNALGVDVKFYSYVTRRRAKSFGLPRRCHVALLPLLFPFVALERLFPQVFPEVVERLMCWALDLAVIMRLRECDVFICMSGLYFHAARYAKWRYGALIHLHRSSRHIVSQREILAEFPTARQVTSFMVKREIRGYGIADHIIVPSSHVVESFSRWPKLYRKLFLNPLGVDIDQFPMSRGQNSSREPTVLFVGQWSYRKGVDVLVRAIEALDDVRLIHVGALTDAPFPDGPRFVHQNHVPQSQLPGWYAAADVFVLPSREDGFGVVLSQALSSGLPVVCSDRTGGPDLARLFKLERLIRIVPAGDPEALASAIAKTLLDNRKQKAVGPITEPERQRLGWRCYAERDIEFMQRMLKLKHLPPASHA
jgi:alpha-maltose-1-phosphate synthase